MKLKGFGLLFHRKKVLMTIDIKGAVRWNFTSRIENPIYVR